MTLTKQVFGIALLCGLFAGGAAHAQPEASSPGEPLVVGGFWAGVANEHQHLWATDGTNQSTDKLAAALGADLGVRVWRGFSLVALFQYTSFATSGDQDGYHLTLGAGLCYRASFARVVFGGGYSKVDAAQGGGGAALNLTAMFPLLAGFGPTIGVGYQWYRHLGWSRADESSYGIVTASVGIGYAF